MALFGAYAKQAQEHNAQRLLPVWQENVEANMDQIIKGKTFRGLVRSRRYKNIYRNKPAFVIGAGPSLDLNKKWLKEVGKKGVIFCTDLAVRVLLIEGIIPDFTVTVDTHKVASLFSHGFPETKQIKMIAGSFVHPLVAKLWDGPVYFFNLVDNHIPWTFNELPKLTGNIGQIPAATNVGACCALAAMQMKCKPIYFVGMDLAFSRMRAWAENTYHDMVWENKGMGWKEYSKPSEAINFGSLENRNQRHSAYIKKQPDLVQVEDIRGNKIITRQLFVGFYAAWLEWAATSWRLKEKMVNATEGGILKGYEFTSLEAAVKKL